MSSQIIPNRIMEGASAPLAIYIHWPYCARICPYCDFNVYKRKEDTALLPAILRDLEHWRELTGSRTITSIHFGGGTPSLMSPVQVGAIIDKVADLWTFYAPEIALEANPHEMSAADWRGYRDAGLTRMSLGIQTFHDPALKFLGRDHDGTTAQSALDLALDIFPSVSADIIFGWAGQTPRMLADDLRRALDAGTQHISTYQLTIEDGTAFAKAEGRGQARAVNTDLSADLYDLVRDTLIDAGFEHYEVSNFAKPSHRSRHNLAYWQGLDYVGVGPGAHGRVTQNNKRTATIAHLTPGAYARAVTETGAGIDSREVLSASDWASEYLLMGLRIDEGISLRRYHEILGEDLNEIELNALVEDGLLTRADDNLKATSHGRLLLNAVTERLLLA
ncbi:coproporphyrinogen III oxidase [Litorimonas cladophorae]|uniref:Heme chaperone HemW n=1 Tax=Litorimonas cladophorae TaxID=1220491 RepID=A0A918NKL8_9PROT|nr:radical SAM family heme chaperone HemW [Litorimonas cladophorae]GGX75499.1 coproporphyrinogen III oxidase [Litorimonas cladophorae]